MYTRCTRLSTWLYNPFDNRLHFVYRHIPVGLTSCTTGCVYAALQMSGNPAHINLDLLFIYSVVSSVGWSDHIAEDNHVQLHGYLQL